MSDVFLSAYTQRHFLILVRNAQNTEAVSSPICLVFQGYNKTSRVGPTQKTTL